MISNLAALINEEGSLSIGEACIYALIGFAIIFIGITLIILVIQFIGIIMKKTDNLAFFSRKKNKKKTISAPEQVTEDGNVPDEVKAAIVAALMAYYAEEKSKCDFKVKRIRRI